MKTLQCILVLFFSVSIFGQEAESPYLEVLTENATIPLKETKVDVQVSGTIAHVRVSQVYHNKGAMPIEAKYVFPLSTQAAIHKMDMSIGNRTIHAKIYEKEKANKVYEKAKKEGKRTSKLDQKRPNVFQMNVGNIMPNDQVTIELYYTEMLIPINGEYQFVFPGVVGPRFVGENASKEKTFNLPYIRKGISDTFDFDINVCINAGIYLQKITSNSHKIDVNYSSSDTAEIFLSDRNINSSNRDFILNYGLRGNEIQSGLLLYQGKEENFFAYMMEPPSQVKTEQIPPREYVFIVDISGSMTGYPLDVSKKLMQNLLGNLRESDSFNILLFAGGSNVFQQEPVVANSQNIQKAMRFLSGNYGGGGTRLLNALETAYKLPRYDENSSRSMVVITDGYVSVEKKAFEIIKNNLNQANVFTFGIGSSVNRYIIEGMAKVANSEFFIATSESDAYTVAERFKKYIENPVLTQIQFETKEFEVYDIEPSSIPDLFSSRPILVFGKWEGIPKGKIIVKGKQGSGDFYKEYKVANGTLSKNNEALKYLWARKKIEQLDDLNLHNHNSKQQVVDLGIKYNLITRYTSFVAVDEQIVNRKGNLKTVKQPLAIPKNVENTAVGASAMIKGKSRILSSYKINISTDDELSKKEERKIKIWFKANFSDLINKQIGINRGVKLYFNANGVFDYAQVNRTGKWVEDEKFSEQIRSHSSNLHSGKKPIVVTITFPLDNSNRKPIVFITGIDQGENQYYSNAKTYFSAKNVDVVDHVFSLEGIINWLNINYDEDPYEEIHIVSHSNSWKGLSLKDLKKGGRITEESLSIAQKLNLLPQLNSVFSDSVNIIFHSCGLGNNKKLLKSLKTVFKGNVSPEVYASPFFNVFEKNNVRHYLAKPYYGYYPTANSPGKVDLSKEFGKRYPDVKINWLNALKNHQKNNTKEFSYKFNIPVEWELSFNNSEHIPNLKNNEAILDFISESDELANQLYRMKIPIEKYRWNYKLDGNKLLIKGKVTVVCILEPILDSKNDFQYEIPSISNLNLYNKV